MRDDRTDLHVDRTPTGDLDAALPGSTVKPLARLHNYRIAEGDPDVRGWEVLGSDGRRIGEVDDLLVDTQALKARYLDVTLDLNLFANREPAAGYAATAIESADSEAAGELGSPALAATLGATSAVSAMGGLAPLVTETVVRATLSEEENRLTWEHHHGSGTRHVLIPIGYAQLDEEHDRVLIKGLRSADAAALPDYNGQELHREYEAGLLQRFDRGYAHFPEGEFYEHGFYDEDRFYGPRRRRVDRGQAIADTARAAGLEPGGANLAGEQDRTITGDLDRAVGAPDHSRLRGEAETPREEAALPVRGQS